ncbi:MAG: polysaccharide deacetylase family protein [Saprospiraceae bacterium]|nr:polysaccharide deacetylase family protein [Saprospiraceae bacterium]
MKFETEIVNQPYTQIYLDNGSSIIVEDHFFNQYPIEKSYFQYIAIPRNVKLANKKAIPFLAEQDIPLLFGNDHWNIVGKQSVLGIDIFAATFFCLTRWEEAVNTVRDLHGRFPASASLAKKFGFLHRPIVDEMAALLRNILEYMGEQLPPSAKKYELQITHDVDQHYLWLNWFGFFKKMGGDILKRRDITTAIFSCQSFLGHKFKKYPDPYDTYDYLMDVSESYGIKSHFYFLAGGNTKYDNKMEQQIGKAAPILKRINDRGHIIGVHPSYLSATENTVFDLEVKRFRTISPQAVTQGRQHFLRFEVGKTWLFWEKNGLQMDSTLGYPEQSGFRCGTCTPFPVFDIFERKQLKLIEAPLTAMDTTYAVYQKATPSEMEADLTSLLEAVKKYKGRFTLLWHNTSFHVPEYQAFAPVYERFLQAATASS